MRTRWQVHTASLKHTHTHLHPQTSAPTRYTTMKCCCLVSQSFPKRDIRLFLSVSAPSWKYDERQIEVVKWDKCSSGGAVLWAVGGGVIQKVCERLRLRSEEEGLESCAVGWLVGRSVGGRGETPAEALMCPRPCGLCSPGTGTWSCVGRPDLGGC